MLCFLLMTITTSAWATSIQGVRLMYPCLICLVLNDRLWDLSNIIYPRQTRDGALWLVAKANNAPSKKVAKAILGGQSIRAIFVSCMEVLQFQAFSWLFGILGQLRLLLPQLSPKRLSTKTTNNPNTKNIKIT